MARKVSHSLAWKSQSGCGESWNIGHSLACCFIESPIHWSMVSQTALRFILIFQVVWNRFQGECPLEGDWVEGFGFEKSFERAFHTFSVSGWWWLSSWLLKSKPHSIGRPFRKRASLVKWVRFMWIFFLQVILGQCVPEWVRYCFRIWIWGIRHGLQRLGKLWANGHKPEFLLGVASQGLRLRLYRPYGLRFLSMGVLWLWWYFRQWWGY